jgi:two-component system, chemotaxis family, chemotaxis protein CheY
MPSILVVEDHPVMRPTLRDLLALEGYTVQTAEDGHDALRHLERHAFDLIITDFMMPELDGLGLLKTLRADDRFTRMPVLMFTAAANPEIRAQVMAAGADDFLLRPITAQDLLRAVQRLLARHKQSS